MMNSINIDQLKNIWQNQVSISFAKAAGSELFAELAERLKVFETKQFRLNKLKTIALILILVPYSLYLLIFKSESALLIFGISWILICTLLFMIFYWKKQFRLTGFNYNLPTQVFLDSIIQNLDFQKKLFRVYFPLFALSLICGVNILYFDLMGQAGYLLRIIYHAAGTGFIVLATLLGLRIRKMKFQKEYQPLIDELKTIHEDIKGDKK